MYQVGNNQGQSYSGKEGEGFATILSLPKTDNIQVWKYENDNKRKQALIDQCLMMLDYCLLDTLLFIFI